MRPKVPAAAPSTSTDKRVMIELLREKSALAVDLAAANHRIDGMEVTVERLTAKTDELRYTLNIKQVA